MTVIYFFFSAFLRVVLKTPAEAGRVRRRLCSPPGGTVGWLHPPAGLPGTHKGQRVSQLLAVFNRYCASEPA